MVSSVVLSLTALLPQLEAFAEIRKGWNLPIGDALGFSLMIWLVSMGGWVIVGLPVVLLRGGEIVTDFYWVTAGLMGAVMSAFAMALIHSLWPSFMLRPIRDTSTLRYSETPRHSGFSFWPPSSPVSHSLSTVRS